MEDKDYKIVLVAPQLAVTYRGGGIGTFIDHFINLLLANGYHHITLIYTSHLEVPKKYWVQNYLERGVQVYTIYDKYERLLPHWDGYYLLTRLSEIVDSIIPDDTDIIYFADYRANGFIPVQRRRYQNTPGPVIVTILHGPTSWHRQGQQQWPVTPVDAITDYMERYVPRYSDFVAAPSQYIFDWAMRNGWKLPPEQQRFLLGYPWVRPETPANEPPAKNFKRIVFFGRLETRKGFDLFVGALLKLFNNSCLRSVEEIVFLGPKGVNIYGEEQIAANILQNSLNIPVTIITTMNSYEAQDYLQKHVADTLVVTPSRSDTFGFVVVESSLISGLNIIFSSAGGMREVLGEAGTPQMFDPDTIALADKLCEWLQSGPRSSKELAQYDWRKANGQWMRFHTQVCEYAAQQKNQPSNEPIVISTPVKSVDVCITNYNQGQYLVYALDSLAQQSCTDFMVCVVDDGSDDPETLAIWKALQTQYANRGWRFIREGQHHGQSQARNLAAIMGAAENLIFMDAANIAAPDMVERFQEAIRISGDDCLVCWLYKFNAPHSHYIGGKQSPVLHPPAAIYTPVGHAPELNLFGVNSEQCGFIIRRSVFEDTNGFILDNYSDSELFTALMLAGYKMDVIPEYLLFQRVQLEDRQPSLNLFTQETRIMNVYQQRLQEVGLEHMLPLLMGIKNTSYQSVSGLNGQFTSTDGQYIFTSQLDYLTNGVSWRQLISAMGHKVAKKLRRRT